MSLRTRLESGRLRTHPRRRGIPRGHMVYEIAPEHRGSVLWNLWHWIWCWIHLRPHMEHWNEKGEVVFRRWWILRLGVPRDGCWGLGLYRHEFRRGFVDFAEHNHPRWAFRLVTKGGYWEDVKLGYASINHTRFIAPWTFDPVDSVMERWVWHRIVRSLPGTITWFLMAGRYEEWAIREEG